MEESKQNSLSSNKRKRVEKELKANGAENNNSSTTSTTTPLSNLTNNTSSFSISSSPAINNNDNSENNFQSAFVGFKTASEKPWRRPLNTVSPTPIRNNNINEMNNKQNEKNVSSKHVSANDDANEQRRELAPFFENPNSTETNNDSNQSTILNHNDNVKSSIDDSNNDQNTMRNDDESLTTFVGFRSARNNFATPSKYNNSANNTFKPPSRNGQPNINASTSASTEPTTTTQKSSSSSSLFQSASSLLSPTKPSIVQQRVQSSPERPRVDTVTALFQPARSLLDSTTPTKSNNTPSPSTQQQSSTTPLSSTNKSNWLFQPASSLRTESTRASNSSTTQQQTAPPTSTSTMTTNTSTSLFQPARSLLNTPSTTTTTTTTTPIQPHSSSSSSTQQHHTPTESSSNATPSDSTSTDLFQPARSFAKKTTGFKSSSTLSQNNNNNNTNNNNKNLSNKPLLLPTKRLRSLGGSKLLTPKNKISKGFQTPFVNRAVQSTNQTAPNRLQSSITTPSSTTNSNKLLQRRSAPQGVARGTLRRRSRVTPYKPPAKAKPGTSMPLNHPLLRQLPRHKDRSDAVVVPRNTAPLCDIAAYEKNLKDNAVSLRSIRTQCQSLSSVSIPNDIANVSLDNAFEFKFQSNRFGSDIKQFISENETELKFENFKTILLKKGATEQMLGKRWLKNHYSMIVWKLACYERSFAAVLTNKYLTASRVLNQLCYRYEKERIGAARPAIRSVLQRDTPASSAMVLCVASILSRSVVVLTDGWYKIRTQFDMPLSLLVASNRIKIGVKLAFCQAQLSNCSDNGTTPLECLAAEESNSPTLSLSFNSTRLAQFDAKLGLMLPSALPPLCIPLSSVKQGGGLVACLQLVVRAVYPLLYYDRQSKKMLTEADENAASQAYSIKQQAHIDAKWRQFQNKSNERNGSDDDKNDDDDDQLNASQSNLMNEAMKNKNFDFSTIDSMSTLNRLLELRPEFIQRLSESQISMLKKYKDEKQENIQRRFRDSLLDDPQAAKRDTSAMFKLRVTDYRDTRVDIDDGTCGSMTSKDQTRAFASVITVWGKPELRKQFKVGKCYRFAALIAGTSTHRGLLELKFNKRSRCEELRETPKNLSIQLPKFVPLNCINTDLIQGNVAVHTVGVIVCSPAPGYSQGNILLMMPTADEKPSLARLELTELHRGNSKSLRAGNVCCLVGARFGGADTQYGIKLIADADSMVSIRAPRGGSVFGIPSYLKQPVLDALQWAIKPESVELRSKTLEDARPRAVGSLKLEPHTISTSRRSSSSATPVQTTTTATPTSSSSTDNVTAETLYVQQQSTTTATTSTSNLKSRSTSNTIHASSTVRARRPHSPPSSYMEAVYTIPIAAGTKAQFVAPPRNRVAPATRLQGRFMLPTTELLIGRFEENGNAIVSLPPSYRQTASMLSAPPDCCFHHFSRHVSASALSSSSSSQSSATSSQLTLLATFRTTTGNLGAGVEWLLVMRDQPLLSALRVTCDALNESSQGSPSVRAMAAKRALQSALNLQQIVDNDNDDEDELNRSPTQKRHRKYKRIGENALITIRKGGLLQHPLLKESMGMAERAIELAQRSFRVNDKLLIEIGKQLENVSDKTEIATILSRILHPGARATCDVCAEISPSKIVYVTDDEWQALARSLMCVLAVVECSVSLSPPSQVLLHGGVQKACYVVDKWNLTTPHTQTQQESMNED